MGDAEQVGTSDGGRITREPMMYPSALEACHAARRAWELSEPQLFLEVDDLSSSAPPGGGSSFPPAPDSPSLLSAPRHSGGSLAGGGADHPAATTSHGPCPADRTAPPANSPATTPPWRLGEGRAAASHTTTVAATTQARESAATVKEEL